MIKEEHIHDFAAAVSVAALSSSQFSTLVTKSNVSSPLCLAFDLGGIALECVRCASHKGVQQLRQPPDPLQLLQ